MHLFFLATKISYSSITGLWCKLTINYQTTQLITLVVYKEELSLTFQSTCERSIVPLVYDVELSYDVNTN